MNQVSDDQLEVRVLQSLEEASPLFDFWDRNASHPVALREVYCELVNSRPEILSPYLIEVRREGQPILLGLFRLERRDVRVRLGYLTCCRQRCLSLTMGLGGLVGSKDRQALNVLVCEVWTLIRGGTADMAYFDGIPLDSDLRKAAEETLPHRARGAVLGSSRHWVMDLPKSGDEFLARLGQKQRWTMRTKNKRLFEQYAEKASYRCSRGEEGADELADQLESVARKTYHRQLGSGFVRDDEHVRRLEALIRNRCLRCYFLEVEGKPCAFYYGARVDSTFYLSYTGFDSAFAQHDPGTILFNYMVHELCNEAAATLDFGIGDAFYKQRYGTRNWEECVYLLLAPTIKGLWLNGLSTLNALLVQLTRWIESKGTAGQRVKTWWRKRLTQAEVSGGSQDAKSDAE